MDFGKAFTFMFEDPEWLRKLGIGTLVGLIGLIFSPVLLGLIPLLMLLGYSLDVVRNVMDGKQHPLPEWDNWGGFLARGFKLCAAIFIWCLPIILVSIPMGIGGALTDQQNGAGGMQAIGALLLICGSCLILLWGIFVTLISPAIYTRLAATNRFTSAFELGKLWAFTRDNIGNVIIAILLTGLAGLIASFIAPLGLIALVIGVAITLPFAMLWSYLVQAHLFGQIGTHGLTAIE